jgi:hypothetical protein
MLIQCFFIKKNTRTTMYWIDLDQIRLTRLIRDLGHSLNQFY